MSICTRVHVVLKNNSCLNFHKLIQRVSACVNQFKQGFIMSKKYEVQLKLKLCGIQMLMAMHDCSRSTINRMVKSGEISSPDIPGGNGKPHKWFQSTADRDLLNRKGLAEVA
jgi:hypothetical protein